MSTPLKSPSSPVFQTRVATTPYHAPPPLRPPQRFPAYPVPTTTFYYLLPPSGREFPNYPLLLLLVIAFVMGYALVLNGS